MQECHIFILFSCEVGWEHCKWSDALKKIWFYRIFFPGHCHLGLMVYYFFVCSILIFDCGSDFPLQYANALCANDNDRTVDIGVLS